MGWTLKYNIKGQQGIQGNDGPQGLPGNDGVDGSPGATGAQGPAGNNGTNGNIWRDGAGVPSNGLGSNNDYYLDDSTGNVYLKSAGAYSIEANIKGSAGTNGTNGTNGSNGSAGAPGAVWRSGSGAPSNGTGIDGDFYLNTANSDVYQRSAGTYSVVVNIKGSTGAAGADGSDGADGLPGADGADGQGVPTGGTTGQVLKKIDATDFNTEWADESGGGWPLTGSFALTGDVSGDMDGHTFLITNGTAGFELDPDAFGFGTGAGSLSGDADKISINLNEGKTFAYNDNYAASFTDHSIVDKAHVQAKFLKMSALRL